MIVLDASVLIGYLDPADVQHEAAERLLSEAIDEEFGVNPITHAEVLVAPARAGRLAEAQEAMREIGVVELSWPPDAAVALAMLRAATPLKLPDCCVLLAALYARATVASFDRRLLTVAADHRLAILGPTLS